MIPSTVELRAPDHEVDVDRALVDARLLRRVLDRMVVAVAERDVARGVLVDQRVVEHAAERPDATFAVDERDLAEP